MLRQMFLSFLMCTALAIPVLLACSTMRRACLAAIALAKRPRPVSWIDQPLASHLEEFRAEIARVH